MIERAVILKMAMHFDRSFANLICKPTAIVPGTCLIYLLWKRNIFKSAGVCKKVIKTEAARLLNIGLTTLYRKMEEYGIP